MHRATQVIAKGDWKDAAETVVLDYDDRHRRRMMMQSVGGLEFLLDLADVVTLRGGDALRLEDGRLIEVVAAPEPLLEIKAADAHEMIRVGWHLGNRHLPTQIAGTKLRIRRDHVIAEMVRGLGAKVVEIEAPFDPEGGAYAQAVQTQGHEHHGHSHHAHDHGHHGHKHHDHHGHDHHDHVWFSPAFPVGAFAYSHGLEWAVEAGDLTSAAEVRDWIAALIEMGSIRNDAILLSAAWRGEAVNDLALALASSKERYLETSAQGTAFVAALRKSWPCAALEALDGDIAYPVAVGTAARGHSLPLHETCAAFALAFVSALVSAAVRLENYRGAAARNHKTCRFCRKFNAG
eukprot:gene6172-6239_t